MRNNDLVALPALREGRIFRGKLGSIKKFPKNSYKILRMNRKLRKKLGIF
jgi:hypothetical protein